MSLKCINLAVPALALLMLTGCIDKSNGVVVSPTPEVLPDPDVGTTPDPDTGGTPELPASLDACQLANGSLTCRQPVTSLADLAIIPGLKSISLSDLDQQELATLPVLPEVTAIEISATTLSSIDLLTSFPALTSLRLDSFKLSETDTSAYRASLSLVDQLQQMTRLESLSITNSDALISQFGTFPDLSPLTNLHTLDLSGNESLFIGSPGKVLPLFTAIGKLSKLTSLSLENTGLSADDNAPLNLSISGKELTTLKLAHNNPSLFANERDLLNTIVAMGNLEALTISNLNSSDHTAFSLTHWPKLTSLGLNYSETLLNQTLLNAILSRSSWQMLGLAGNRLTLSAQSLANLQPETIRELDISGNTVDQTPDSNGQTLSELIASFTNLEVLDLSGLELTSLTLGTMPKLHTLDLDNNKLVSFTLSEGQMPALQNLNLMSNDMTTLSVGTLPTLRTLDLRLNQFKTLTFPEGQMPALQSLDLSFMSSLTSLATMSFPQLETLSLTNSSLTAFTAGDMPALQVLDISYGTLTNYIAGNLPALEVFDLEGNRLTQFDASDMPALQNLRLRNNQLTTFTTSGNPQLQVLHLGSNKLQAFTSGIGELPKLLSLNLENNQLTGLTITEGQLPEMSTLKVNLNREFNSLMLADDQRVRGTTVEAVGTGLTEEQQAQLQADYPTITFKFSFVH